jgi:hypothetical protein
LTGLFWINNSKATFDNLFVFHINQILSNNEVPMTVVSKLVGPKSKYDKTLPYIYMGKIDVLDGQGIEPVFDFYFADTICGLIEYLDEHNIFPDEVSIAGIYRTKEYVLDNSIFTNKSGEWLQRPQLCKALEAHYKKTKDQWYKGHVDNGECCFEDRDRQGSGPF